MYIRNKHPHLSVGAFELDGLPDFLVILGLNGSGKSQLLNGISAKKITVKNTADGMSDPRQIVIISKENDIGATRLTSSASTAIDQIQDDHNIHLMPEFEMSKFDEIRETFLSETRKEIENFLSLELGTFENWTDPVDTILEKNDLESTDENLEFLRSALIRAETAITADENESLATPGDFRVLVKRISALGEKSPFEVTETNLRLYGSMGTIDPFSPKYADIFVAYRDAQHRNRFQRMEDQDEGTNLALDPDKFLAHFGPPPWETMSETIQQGGLEFEFVPPEQSNKSTEYHLQLRKIDGQNPIQISKLSSGEQVRIMFALAAFRYDPLLATLVRPSLLLLDEMDASLHPSILREWIGMLAEDLPKKQRISSILTTHSPVTVALAPEKSLYEMVEGEGVPRKISKHAAMNKLLVGVPSLAIDFSGRRQVIVEAGLDAELYQKVFDQIKSVIDPQRSLAFIPASGVNRRDGGTSRVIDLTERFQAEGNLSVMGLTDWDQSRTPTDRIKVLGKDQFYAIENVILNPLLIASFLLKKTNLLRTKGWTFSTLLNSNTQKKQEIVDHIQDELVANTSFSGKKELVQYLGGFSLDILVDFNRKNGHELQKLLAGQVTGFPNSSDPTRPMKELVDHGILEHPPLCPQAFADVFLELANTDINEFMS